MIRILPAVLLSLVLVVTSQAMAQARGAAAATGQMVICTGAGPVVVFTDADGQPTAAPMLCPDAALPMPLGPGAIAPDAPSGRLARVTHPAGTVTSAPPVPASVPAARGPPRQV